MGWWESWDGGRKTRDGDVHKWWLAVQVDSVDYAAYEALVAIARERFQ